MAVDPRVFFSHSTDDGSDERKVLMSLVDGLPKKYKVLLDRKDLKLGEGWRSTINLWIEKCHAAVILITPQSIASPFCQYEWSLLTYRLTRQAGNFLIIPIYLNAGPNDIKGMPHQLYEVAGTLAVPYDKDTIAHLVTERLAPLSAKDEEGQLQVLHISKLLKDAVNNNKIIEAVASRINLDLGTWDLSVDCWDLCAVKLMGIGLKRATPMLRNLQRYFRDEDDLKDIIDLIGLSSWVDVRSSQRIRDRGKPDNTEFGPVGLNAKQCKTAKCYVLNGSERTPRDLWPVGFALNVVGSRYEDLYKRVEQAVCEALKLDNDADEARIKKKLKAIRENEEAVFVVLEARGLSADRLAKLCASELFASVNFIILTSDDGARGLLPDKNLLTPMLPLKFEDDLWSEYDTVITDNFGFKQV